MSEDADSVACDHPLDAILYNEFNEVTQCHRCGEVIDGTAANLAEAIDLLRRGWGFDDPPSDDYERLQMLYARLGQNTE